MTDRPLPPSDAPEGFVYVIKPSEKWVAVGNGAKESRRCRWLLGKDQGRRACGKPSVAALNRGKTSYSGGSVGRKHDAWWHYCPDHLHGHWVEAGAVFHWHLVPLEEAR